MRIVKDLVLRKDSMPWQPGEEKGKKISSGGRKKLKIKVEDCSVYDS